MRKSPPRTQITPEETRDMFPMENIKAFKKVRCFDKLLEEIVKYTNSQRVQNLDTKVIMLSKTLNLRPLDLLMQAFTWEKSIYGHRYWFDMYHKLDDVLKKEHNV